MGESILVASGKGGVGKSTLSAALGQALSKAGKKIVLMDCDVGLRCEDLMLNMQDQILYDFSDILEHNCTPDEALYPVPEYENLKLLCAPQFLRAAEIRPKDVKKTVEALKASADYLLMDCPAGLGRNLKINISSADRAILVTTPDDIAVRTAEKAAQLLESYGITHPYILFNRTDKRMIRRGDMMSPYAVAQQMDLPLLGLIPDSYDIYRALLNHKTAYECEDRLVVTAITEAAQRLADGTAMPFEEPLGPIARFFRRI